MEKEPTVVAYLQEVLRKRGDTPKDDGYIRILPGVFEEKIDSIITHIKSRGKAHRAIFVLDQYGYTGVPVAIIARIFQELPNAEIFLTLAVGWITAYLPNARVAAEKLGLNQKTFARLCAGADEELDINDPNKRPDLLAVQRLLHHVFTNEVGSRFYTPFFIISRDSNRPYWFLHMANNPRANDVVKTLHWEIENHFEHFGRSGLVMLGYDPSADNEVIDQLKFQFDDQAKESTHTSLLVDIPQRIFDKYPDGVTFGKLFQDTCNETPATKKLIAEAVSKLCIEGELEKVGVNGERRASSTLPFDDDEIWISSQTKFNL